MPRLTDDQYKRLQKVEEFFSDPGNWCAYHMTIQAHGGRVRHCVLGAWTDVSIGHADPPTIWETHRDFMRNMNELKRILGVRDTSVTHWNDTEGYDVVITRIREVLHTEREAHERDQLVVPDTVPELELV